MARLYIVRLMHTSSGLHASSELKSILTATLVSRYYLVAVEMCVVSAVLLQVIVTDM